LGFTTFVIYDVDGDLTGHQERKGWKTKDVEVEVIAHGDRINSIEK
jgi:hypothetical protein